MLAFQPPTDLMKLARRIRSDAPLGHHLGQHLGKTLAHTQNIHATEMTDAKSVATRPIVAVRNAMLSATGGLRRDVQEPFKHPKSKVFKVSHHDAKNLMMTSMPSSRKVFNSTMSKAGL